ncbi:Hypothetical predicted protein [Lynx pardinus]|uniref:Uncharacterized protein n=1 Tax=Lynx pardinus TaxID=191816 RepID=A0A485N1W0_LYNPA|nr:Hypothetical predicted protein [Lynx pardinus]
MKRRSQNVTDVHGHALLAGCGAVYARRDRASGRSVLAHQTLCSLSCTGVHTHTPERSRFPSGCLCAVRALKAQPRRPSLPSRAAHSWLLTSVSLPTPPRPVPTRVAQRLSLPLAAHARSPELLRVPCLPPSLPLPHSCSVSLKK